ncbi:hypothetical protein J5226_03935 [Lysobacter sp. K5869]|uniref:hypothetical protein n=1 Tax=Lysobacter sp. K5869 TaxID=2820808 RepID=UPI001C0618E1|nr:hypothetical protein [Lysobacter sp. K5869]QWP77568.1 hypothetical protein J5226_03935 [Lysobacter sp. K5869]
MFAAALAVCSLALAGAALSQPGPYVEIRTYTDNAGNTIGMQLISRGCADPQPPGWGVWSGAYTVDRGRCFVIAPPGGGEQN